MSPPWGEWADLAGTAIASQPVRWAEQAPNYISSSKNQGDNRRRMSRRSQLSHWEEQILHLILATKAGSDGESMIRQNIELIFQLKNMVRAEKGENEWKSSQAKENLKIGRYQFGEWTYKFGFIYLFSRSIYMFVLLKLL